MNKEDQKPLPAAPPLASAAPQTFTGLLKYLQISTGSLKYPQISLGISILVYISITFAFLWGKCFLSLFELCLFHNILFFITTVRDRSRYQNGWIFRKAPNGFCSRPPSFLENHIPFFSEKRAQKAVYKDPKFAT